MTILRRSPSGPPVDIEAGEVEAGLQTAWAIDPLNGSDDPGQAGTPAEPLATMAEFNSRYQGVLVKVPAVLQLVGNVVDTAFMPQGVTLDFGASLTVLGTRTPLVTGVAISAVAQLGNLGAGAPFELTTSGVDWLTQPANAQLVITSSVNAASVGAVGFISSQTDALNAPSSTKVVVGQFTSTIAGTVTPVAGDVISINSLSQALPPQVLMNALTTGSTIANSLFFNDISWRGTFSQFHGGSVYVRCIGCELIGGAGGQQVVRTTTQVAYTGCRVTQSNLFRLISAGSQMQFTNCVFASGNATLTNSIVCAGGNFFITRCCFNNAPLRANTKSQVATGSLDFRNTRQPIGLDDFATFACGGVIAGSVGNTDSGIRVDGGSGFWWSGSANKPTVLGGVPGTDDVRIGGNSMSYATLNRGWYAIFNNANPNSILNLQPNLTVLAGNGPGAGSWMCER
jgi:hypothetical protein